MSLLIFGKLKRGQFPQEVRQIDSNFESSKVSSFGDLSFAVLPQMFLPQFGEVRQSWVWRPDLEKPS